MKFKEFLEKIKFKPDYYSATFWVKSIIALILILIFYFILMDRYTPYTSDAYIQAYVVQVAPQVEGRVIEVEVSNNQEVKKGNVLFQIDPRPYEYTVSQLKAELVQTQQEIDQIKSDIIAMEAALKSALANLNYAQKRYNDLKPLAEKNYIAQLEFDEALDNLNSSKAAVLSAEANLQASKQKLEFTIDGEYALIRNAEAQLATAQYDLDQTTVYAPTDGIVTNLQLTKGAYIDVGTAVLTLVDTDSWWIVANFKENSLSRIEPGQKAELSIAMYPGKIFKAHVESADWGVSTGQGIPSGELPVVENMTTWVKLAQRFPVRLKLDEENNDYNLRIGGSVTVTVFNSGGFLLNGLAKLWLRIGSYVNYLY